MTILKFKANVEGQAAAFAVPEPRNVRFEDEHFIVQTDEHYVEDPLPEIDPAALDAPSQQTQDVVLQVLKDLGVLDKMDTIDSLSARLDTVPGDPPPANPTLFAKTKATLARLFGLAPKE